MADLNELSEFEKNLRSLIESRNGFDNSLSLKNQMQEGFTKTPRNQAIQTYMMVEEHGKPFITRMVIPEHGQPFRQKPQTLMMVMEHGQPYNTKIDPSMIDFTKITTDMIIPQHGQPYKRGPYPPVTKEDYEACGKMGMFMAAPEHGQPYKTVRPQTKMAAPEHGQPYEKDRYYGYSITEKLTSLINPDKAEHDYMARTCFDYCPNFAGKKCGRPGCI